MGDSKKNPKEPFEVEVPNKIRKRIAMHKKDSPVPDIISPLIKLYRKPAGLEVSKRGSMWSRFIKWIR